MAKQAKKPGTAVVRAGQIDPKTGRKALPGTGAPGPGRPKGSVNSGPKAEPEVRRRAKDILQQILRDGPTPLEIMWNFLRYPWLCKTCRSPVREGHAACEFCGGKELLRNVDEALLNAAKAAAPYVHPRLAQITLAGTLSVAHEDALARLDRLDAGEEEIPQDADFEIIEDGE